MSEQHPRPGKPSRRYVRYSIDLKRRCMLLLQLRHDRFREDPDAQVIKAALLGRALGHWPGVQRETLRRRVRELVNEMRRDGAPIASGGGGYWIAKTVQDFNKTESFLRAHGIAELATNARIKQTAARSRAAGQLRLAPYHAVVTGSLAQYLGDQIDRYSEPTESEPPRSEQSDLTWSDSLFAA